VISRYTRFANCLSFPPLYVHQCHPLPAPPSSPVWFFGRVALTFAVCLWRWNCAHRTRHADFHLFRPVSLWTFSTLPLASSGGLRDENGRCGGRRRGMRSTPALPIPLPLYHNRPLAAHLARLRWTTYHLWRGVLYLRWCFACWRCGTKPARCHIVEPFCLGRFPVAA